MVRIQDSQSWHRGSIPLSTTKRLSSEKMEAFFVVFATQIRSPFIILLFYASFFGRFPFLFYLCSMKELGVIKNRTCSNFCRDVFARALVLCGFLSVSDGMLAQRSEIFKSRIASLQVVAGDNWQSMPVVALHGDPICIAFDDLTHEYHRYVYKIEHCDADWKVSSGLFVSDYISGFNGDLTIDDYDESLNTNQLYTHYRLRIPNENCRITMSGNYKLSVYDENNNNAPVLTACFMVVDPQVNVSLGYTSNTDIDVNKSHQQVGISLQYGDVRVTDPMRQLRTVVLQNGRWDNAVWDAKPDYVSAEGLQWAHQRNLIFPAGNVYRKFEMLDMNHTTMGLEELKWDGEHFHAFVFQDQPRPSYVHDEAPQGSFFIRNSDNTEIDYTADYAWVHFSLKAPRQMGDVYLNGDWTQDSFLPQYRMGYDEDRGEYRAAVLLKQGYYSYQYLVLRDDGSTMPVASEGSFFQTVNKYQVLVYYRGQGDRTDKLVGFAESK